jgi:queuine tRNA-ribosyltransferase
MNIFTITARDKTTSARNGLLALAHGVVVTPAFMPVGTNATVKAVELDTLEDMGINLILSNAYHLFLRPGIEVIEHSGGLHRFMAWNHNILTDSGGFQVFSLAGFRKMDDEGVSFRSHIDGALHRLSPEDVVRLQVKLGSDIMMPLDVCTAFGASRAEAETAIVRTGHWASLSKKCRQETDSQGLLFGIVQGNFFSDLRTRSAAQLAELDLPGYAIGGLSVGENYRLFEEYLSFTAPLLPPEKPRYVMGIGTPPHIIRAVGEGIDLFDCVFPTRTARNALVFTEEGTINLRNEKFKFDTMPLDPACYCRTCKKYSKSYIRHLYKTKEILAAIIVTRHNLFFLQSLMEKLRTAILLGEYESVARAYLQRYGSKKKMNNNLNNHEETKSMKEEGK